MIRDLQPVFPSFLVLLSSLGRARNRKLSPDHPLKLNIVLCLTLLLNLFGFAGYFRIQEFQFLNLPLFTDSESARKLATNDVFHERSKHLEVDCDFIRQHVRSGTIKLIQISSAAQIADFFTKSHSTSRFSELVSKLSMVTFSHPKLERGCKDTGPLGLTGQPTTHDLGQPTNQDIV